MDEIATLQHIPAMSPAVINHVRQAESVLRCAEQVELDTHHVIHAGLYARTIRIPAGVVITGVEIKIATLLIVNGHCEVFTGQGTQKFVGYHVVPACAHRKQMILAIEDTDLTMIFATRATSIRDAEEAFTDEIDQLQSHHGGNTVVITKE
jgi:hypothetical protein